jgi:hypothetical protein
MPECHTGHPMPYARRFSRETSKTPYDDKRPRRPGRGLGSRREQDKALKVPAATRVPAQRSEICEPLSAPLGLAPHLDSCHPDSHHPADSRRPDLRRPDSRRPDSRRPDSRRPDSRRPDSRRPDSRRPDSRRRAALTRAAIALSHRNGLLNIPTSSQATI